MAWFNKTFTRRCPDGTTHTIYRNIDDAFPLYIVDKDDSFSGKVNVDRLAQTELGAKYVTRVKGLLFELDSANQNIMLDFRAVYAVYQGEPCGNAKFFSKQISYIIEDQKKLRQLKILIAGLVSLLGSNNISENIVIETFLSIANSYGKYVPVQAAKAKTHEMAEESKDWQKPINLD